MIVLNYQKRSSLAYQFLLYFNAWYMLLYLLSEIAVFIWKGELSVIFCYVSSNVGYCDLKVRGKGKIHLYSTVLRKPPSAALLS